MLTGPRRGEISALRWRHIDFERGLLSIIRSNAQPKASLKEKHTKTGQARKIALDTHTVELLTAHRQRWEQRLDELGAALSPDAFVFSTAPDGLTPYMPRAISQRYRKLALKLKLRSTRLHSLRHKLLFMFDCGDLGADEGRIRLPADELDCWKWVDAARLDDFVIERISPRVRAAIQGSSAAYLEYGRPTSQ